MTTNSDDPTDEPSWADWDEPVTEEQIAWIKSLIGDLPKGQRVVTSSLLTEDGQSDCKEVASKPGGEG